MTDVKLWYELEAVNPKNYPFFMQLDTQNFAWSYHINMLCPDEAVITGKKGHKVSKKMPHFSAEITRSERSSAAPSGCSDESYFAAQFCCQADLKISWAESYGRQDMLGARLKQSAFGCAPIKKGSGNDP
jgi:hypothetical protein